MQGTIIAFSRELRAGYIFGDDGEQYIFSVQHWHADRRPQAALKVSFDGTAGEALNIIPN